MSYFQKWRHKMGDDSKFYKGVFLLSLTFAAGFSCGYQADRQTDIQKNTLLFSCLNDFIS
jgi:hypothetical protein